VSSNLAHQRDTRQANRSSSLRCHPASSVVDRTWVAISDAALITELRSRRWQPISDQGRNNPTASNRTHSSGSDPLPSEFLKIRLGSMSENRRVAISNRIVNGELPVIDRGVIRANVRHRQTIVKCKTTNERASPHRIDFRPRSRDVQDCRARHRRLPALN